MKFPIESSSLTSVCATPPEPVMDFETRKPKADENGEPLFAVGVLAMANGDAEVISVKVAGKPAAGVVPGAAVKLVGLVAAHWSMEGRSGLYFRAIRIEPVASAGRAAS